MTSDVAVGDLSFVDVASFLRSYQPGRTGLDSNHNVLEQFLLINISAIVCISSFQGNQDAMQNLKPLKSIELRGFTCQTIAESSCSQAISLVKLTGLDYKELLRVFTQAKSKISPRLTSVQLAHRAFQERNAVLDILLSLLNDKELATSQEKVMDTIIKKKSEICTDMIRLLREITLDLSAEPEDVSSDLSEREVAEILQLKKCQNLIYLTNILRALTMLVLNVSVPIDVVHLWFDFLNETRLSLHTMCSGNTSIPKLISAKIESLITLVTLLMLGLDSTTLSIDLDAPYYQDVECFKKINLVLKKDFISPVVLYMWSFILFFKSCAFEENPDREVQFIQKVFADESIHDVMTIFAARAESGDVFGSIKKLSVALSAESLYSAIISAYVSLSINFIPLNSHSSDMIKDVLLKAPKEFIESFLSDGEFEKKLTVLKAKLPLIDEALLPLINLTTVHPQFANFEWKSLSTYAVKSKLAAFNYDISDGGEAADLIVLKEETYVKPPLEFDKNVYLPLPEDTKGKILPVAPSSDEEVIVFIYEYSGWALLGRVLQNICELYVRNDRKLKTHTRDIMISIIELTTQIVSPATPFERSMEIIEYLSASVTEGDIVSVILRILDHSLHKRNYEVASICSEFLFSLFPNYPHFVWSHIARSDLLDRYGKTGLASTILGSVELATGKYDFTLSLVKLADEMASESISLESGFSSRTKKDILEKLTNYLIDIFESYQYWKYANVLQRFEMGYYLTSFFTKVLYAVYGLDPGSSPSEKVTKTLSVCGTTIMDAFLGSRAPGVRPAKALLNILLSFENSQIALVGDGAFGYVCSRLVKQSFELASLLISLRGLLKMAPSSLEKMMYASSPKLVDIYNLHPSLKRHVVRLFHSLVKVPWSENYLFLLSFLGEEHAEILLNSISSDLDSPLSNHKLSKDLYIFFGALMESKQDGLSILFLTGSIATNETQSQQEETIGKTSVLSILKKNALNLNALPDDVACCLLDSIAYAFNTWANAKDCDADAELISVLLHKVKAFAAKEVRSVNDMNAELVRYRLISRIVEIFALYLFTSSEIDSQISSLLNRQDLAQFIRPFFQLNGYDKPLHDSLSKRFEEKWPKLKLSRFAVTPLYNTGIFSQDSIFAISLMDQIFGDDEKWMGSETTDGYRDEIIVASSNLKYVTHKIAAAKAWGALLTTFVKKNSQPLQASFLDLAACFLQINLDMGIEVPLFAGVYCERLQLVFYILYSFQKKAEPVGEKILFQLLELLAAVFKTDEVGFVSNIGHSARKNFYRPVLRSILLVLSFVTTGTHFIEMESDTLLELFELSFSKGVYLILSEILSDISTSTSSGRQVTIYNMEERVQDLFLMLSIFTTIKALRPPNRFNLIMASSLREVGTLKVILNLYSSSHLFKFNGESVFGPLTLTFISELCTVSHIAESFIASGLFAVILESPLSVAIQQGGIQPERQTNLHSVWTNGILSVILLLLSQFGGKIMPECCLFASYFSQQIRSAIYRWSDSKPAVSSALIRETSQLILFQRIMRTLDYQQFLTKSPARYEIGDQQEEVELIVGLDTAHERKALKNTLNRLLTHPKYLNSRIVPTSLEEQHLLENETTRLEFVKTICKHIKELQECLSEA
ncbi:hypothetical protein HG536_0H00780 [Torulaspora globosa]|uniref:Nucleoporin NUP188 n=1 Tax=Torulaspora globosa TaxID=48254 RepID=A0A7G3ZMG7_9SACH|nr:uncharacterized protein HG536_0H00780 [Torulaspora globosa]QLL34703.1 hypothetical protein HG536_0H00780 [Torulaspora globosa]